MKYFQQYRVKMRFHFYSSLIYSQFIESILYIIYKL
jgi:hypothetical protein